MPTDTDVRRNAGSNTDVRRNAGSGEGASAGSTSTAGSTTTAGPTTTTSSGTSASKGTRSNGDAVDLHLHSHHSDGVLTPAQVVDLAAVGGVRLLALTDHDTVAGLEETRTQCSAHGISHVAGVELSATWNGQTIHVLGFDFDPAAPVLTSALTELQSLRRTRMREIGRRLERKRNAAGTISATALVEQLEGGHVVVTRTHLARALVAAGAARSLGDAFKRLLGRGAPGHVASTYPALAATVECIRAAGGIAVLAHPLRYSLSAGARRRMLEEFRAAGGAGIEVVCGNARSHVDGLAQLALRFGLAGSVGSDFHDPQLPWNPPGRLAKLPASVSAVWRQFRLPTEP